jgi:hypothetical protein
MSLQGAPDQRVLFELEPSHPEPKSKRTRGKGRPKVERPKQLTLPRHLRIVNEEGDANPCDSGPGVCLVLDCKDNLIGEITQAGNLHIPSVDGVPGMTIPIATRRFGGASEQGPRPVTNEDLNDCSMLVVRRVRFLMGLVGSSCRRDVPATIRAQYGPLSNSGGISQGLTGLILGASKQRVDQVERSAMRKLKRNARARELHELSSEQDVPRYQPRSPGVTVRRKE